MNKVFLIGYTGKDPEVMTTDAGLKIARFSLATNESYKNKDGEKVEKTEWFNIVAFKGRAETLEKYVKKGSRLAIEGKFQSRTYEKDGQTKYFTEVVVLNFEFLDKKEEGTGGGQVNQPPPAEIDLENFNDVDDLPF